MSFLPNIPVPTEEQQKIHEEFKQKVIQEGLDKPDIFSDHALYRFLRARRYDLTKSFDMYKTFVEWREKVGVIDIKKVISTIEHLENSLVVLPEPDKYGRAIVVLTPRLHNPAVRNADPTPALIGFTYMMEDVFKKTTADQLLFVVNLQGFQMRNNDVGLMGKILEVFQNYYPERLGAAIVVHAPWIFTPVWAVYKLFLDQVTVAKIHFLGKDYSERFLEIMDKPDCLLDELGGTMPYYTPVIDSFQPGTKANYTREEIKYLDDLYKKIDNGEEFDVFGALWPDKARDRKPTEAPTATSSSAPVQSS